MKKEEYIQGRGGCTGTNKKIKKYQKDVKAMRKPASGSGLIRTQIALLDLDPYIVNVLDAD